MDMTRSWIMSAAAEQSRPLLINYNDTLVSDLSPEIEYCFVISYPA
jgi:hypothetical protein